MEERPACSGSPRTRVRIVFALRDPPIILSIILYTLTLRIAATEWFERGKFVLLLGVGLIVFLQADAIVRSIVRRYQLSPLSQTDVRFRNASVVFRIVGCATVIAGIWGLVRSVTNP